MLANDKWIAENGRAMIYPFYPEKISKVGEHQRIISKGTSQYGYDLSLSADDFRLYQSTGFTIDPKNFYDGHLVPACLHVEHTQSYFVIPPKSSALGVSAEYLQMPANVTGLCIGKSTYARCGVVVHITPVEAGWCGYLTMEIFNGAEDAVRVYAGEGICQVLLFVEDEECAKPYNGKYQRQLREVTLPRMEK